MRCHELERLLTEAGIKHQVQFGFSQMVSGCSEQNRIVCAETERDDGFHGISFWLYGDADVWYVGLWSGVYYRVLDAEQLLQIVKELLSGKIVTRGRAPAELPEEYCLRAGLSQEG